MKKRGGGRRVPLLLLASLVLVGAGVLFARETRLGRALDPHSAEPTLTEVSVATKATVGAASSALPAVEPTPAPAAAVAKPAAKATVAPARVAAAAAGATATPARVRGSTPGTAAAAHTPAITSALTSGPATGAATATPNPSTAAPEVGAVVGPAGSVALTFDAGADRGYAQDILDVLAAERVSASFGVTGQWARANPDVVRRMAAEGHLIINHTLDHHSFTGVSDKLSGLSAARRRAELDDAEAIIAPLIGHSTRPFYRLPYGDDDAQVAADVAPAGYTQKVGWTVDSLGWRGWQSADIVARCLKTAAAGGVYVFHVGRASQDLLALPQIIHGLRDKGFSFRRIDQPG